MFSPASFQSAGGLDSHISETSVLYQAHCGAAACGLKEADIVALVNQYPALESGVRWTTIDEWNHPMTMIGSTREAS